MSREAGAWLARVNHDLCKRLLWPARDRRDLGGPVRPGELVTALVDDDGNPVSAGQLWAELRAGAPAGAPDALEAFGGAVAAAQQAARADDLGGVLALESAFEALARKVKEPTAAPGSPDPKTSR